MALESEKVAAVSCLITAANYLLSSSNQEYVHDVVNTMQQAGESQVRIAEQLASIIHEALAQERKAVNNEQA